MGTLVWGGSLTESATMLAILYKVTIHDRTTRFWDAFLPEISVLKAAFPGLGGEKFIVEPTGIVKDIDPAWLWERMLTKWPKIVTAQYGGDGDPSNPSPNFMSAAILMENESNKLMLAKDRTPISEDAKRELAAARLAQEKAAKAEAIKQREIDAQIELEELQAQARLSETQEAIAAAKQKIAVKQPVK